MRQVVEFTERAGAANRVVGEESGDEREDADLTYFSYKKGIQKCRESGDNLVDFSS